MIHLDYRNILADREMTDEERQGAIHFFSTLIAAGG